MAFAFAAFFFGAAARFAGFFAATFFFAAPFLAGAFFFATFAFLRAAIWRIVSAAHSAG
ncbi:MAG TPA: hypothetical protein VEI82_06355 [Myxococcota bacterium]|nr:hypothetical protein [Myxococcota bacterium]